LFNAILFYFWAQIGHTYRLIRSYILIILEIERIKEPV